mmetsp:Transcript_5024/g.6809  ORF Transcript_5024/g.6809 Transcript_5024/m.6809 type:complete len:268 (+) Transcript_5024:100-903(+)
MSSTRDSFTALGFCGADDSVDPQFLGLLSQAYPFIEFGVLFRPDKEGTPRYASPAWVEELKAVARKSNGRMKLAAHLCGTRVNDILQRGEASFLKSLDGFFGRCQINATAVNGVDTSDLSGSVPNLLTVIGTLPNMEFIIQKNEETSPLWSGLLSSPGGLPSNVTFLLDESKGTGVFPGGWDKSMLPVRYNQCKIGFAGGIGPSNIQKVMKGLSSCNLEISYWIDMESSLRSIKNDVDVFDLDKCFKCIKKIISMEFFEHPEYVSLP